MWLCYFVNNVIKNLVLKKNNYIFCQHAKERQLEIKRKKDTYKESQDWNYCIEGKDLDERTIRVIISFSEDLMLIITVINIY
jgi:hypothetical protein